MGRRKLFPFLNNLMLTIIIILVVLCPLLNAFLSEVINGFIGKTHSEFIYSNEDEDVTVEIDELEQERMLKEAALKCYIEMSKTSNSTDSCPIFWDSIICWPEIKKNRTIYLPCVPYINKFNRKKKAFKHCLIDPNNSKPVWSKANYSLCLEPSANFVENIQEAKIMEKHMNNILVVRICGYVISMVTLTLSIIILLRPKLRCPRNFVHINLFMAFAVRTILLMIIESTTISHYTATNATNKGNESEAEEFLDKVDDRNIPCKVLVSIYRYSGCVYQVAIFSEALYLTLLLKFPYYSEKKGCKFAILISWTLPFTWMIPWVLVKAFVNDFWCWQTESNANLLIKIPNSLALIANVICATIIIRILYSKMRNRNMSREKLMKYRRLAKSIFILIPIFGLHFLLFVWIPYADISEINPIVEVVMTYIETFFNAFQGFVVSITCCFIQREVRIECLLFMCRVLQKIKCLRSFECMACLDSDYIRQLRYKYHQTRNASISISGLNNQFSKSTSEQRSSTKARSASQPGLKIYKDEEVFDTISITKKKSRSRFKSVQNIENVPFNVRKISTSPSVASSIQVNHFFCCLFGNQKNDFYSTSSRKSLTNGFKRSGKNRFENVEIEPLDDNNVATNLETNDLNRSSSSKSYLVNLKDKKVKLKFDMKHMDNNNNNNQLNNKSDDNRLLSNFSDSENDISIRKLTNLNTSLGRDGDGIGGGGSNQRCRLNTSDSSTTFCLTCGRPKLDFSLSTNYTTTTTCTANTPITNQTNSSLNNSNINSTSEIKHTDSCECEIENLTNSVIQEQTNNIQKDDDDHDENSTLKNQNTKD